MGNLSEMVGIDYAKKDCWQLCQLFYKKVFGIELQSYYEHTPKDRTDRQALIFTNVGEFVKVQSSPEFGDLVLIKILGVESHIGVFVGDNKMLHTTEKTGSVIESLSKWKPRISGFFRLEGK